MSEVPIQNELELQDCIKLANSLVNDVKRRIAIDSPNYITLVKVSDILATCISEVGKLSEDMVGYVRGSDDCPHKPSVRRPRLSLLGGVKIEIKKPVLIR